MEKSAAQRMCERPFIYIRCPEFSRKRYEIEIKCQYELAKKSCMDFRNLFDLKWTLKVKGQGQTSKTLKSNIWKTVRDRAKVSKEVKYKFIYQISNSDDIFDLRWPLKVRGQGQTLKTLKSNISKTVRDRDKVKYLKNGLRKRESVNRS